jgi:putative membrane protein
VIVKRNLSPRRVVQYTAGPLAWAAAWAVGVPAVYAATNEPWLVLPFAPVAALGAALAIFIAFRNNTAFNRWNEARSAWQAIVVASRVLARQVLASSANASAAQTASAEITAAYARELVLRQAAFAHLVAGRLRPEPDWERVTGLLEPGEVARLRQAANPPNLLLQQQAVRIKDGIRAGTLGQFDPISLEPQLAALNAAQGVVERLKHTPTPRQYEYFTRRFVQVFAVLVPFGVLSLVPDTIWWTPPLALVLAGVFVVMAVTGSANDEPFANRVTDVPIAAICTELERDLREQLGERDLPPLPEPVDGYLW